MRQFGLFLLGLGKTACPYMYLPTYPTYGKLKKFALETANAWGLSSSILFSTTFLEPQLPLAYRCGLRFRNSFVFTTRPPRDAAPSCNSCPSRPQGRRHICQCARSAGSRWVPQCERALQLQCSLALRRCATAAKHVWTSRTALLRCSRLAARSRPTTRSTRGSWRGLTHDLCYPSAGPAAVSQRASFLAPSC